MVAGALFFFAHDDVWMGFRTYQDLLVALTFGNIFHATVFISANINNVDNAVVANDLIFVIQLRVIAWDTSSSGHHSGVDALLACVVCTMGALLSAMQLSLHLPDVAMPAAVGCLDPVSLHLVRVVTVLKTNCAALL